MLELIKLLAAAQIASSSGKNFAESDLMQKLSRLGEMSMVNNAFRMRYSAKDVYIRKALLYAARHRQISGIHYSVQKDTQHVAKYLVYFNIRIDGKRLQCSFHSFDDSLEKWITKGMETHWVGATRHGKKTEFIDSAQAISMAIDLLIDEL